MLNRKTIMIFTIGAISASCAHNKIELAEKVREVASEKTDGTETGNPVGKMRAVIKPNGSVELSGEDAKLFESIFGQKKFQVKGSRGITSVSCVSDSRCLVEMDKDGIYRSNRDEYNGNLASGPGDNFLNNKDFVETKFERIDFYKETPVQDGEKFIVTPSGSYYYHDRANVLRNDQKIYGMMKKSKSSFVTETQVGDKTILAAQTDNIKMTCYKTDNPLIADAGDFEIGQIAIKYSCRTYFKAQATPLSQPIVVNTRDARTEIYKLTEKKDIVPAEGVKVRQILDPNPSMVTGGTKQFTAYTNEAGVLQVDKEMAINYSDYKTQDAALVIKVEVDEYARKVSGIQSCKKMNAYGFITGVSVDARTNLIHDTDERNTVCGTYYSGIKGLKNGMNYPKAIHHPVVYEKVKNGGYAYVSKTDIELKCVLVGTAVYPQKGIDVAAMESFDAGIARMQATCN